MRNYVAVVFASPGKAYEGLHALWRLDATGEITVFGSAVIHRDKLGMVQVDTKETHPVVATGVGVAIGALLGALAGPPGAAVGAAAGAVIGGAMDLERADTRQQAMDETRFVLKDGQSAVIADISEDWTTPLDTRMRGVGGHVYRRPKSALQDDACFGYDSYLSPYEYIPPRHR